MEQITGLHLGRGDTQEMTRVVRRYRDANGMATYRATANTYVSDGAGGHTWALMNNVPHPDGDLLVSFEVKDIHFIEEELDNIFARALENRGKKASTHGFKVKILEQKGTVPRGSVSENQLRVILQER